MFLIESFFSVWSVWVLYRFSVPRNRFFETWTCNLKCMISACYVSLSLLLCVCLPFKLHSRSPPEDSALPVSVTSKWAAGAWKPGRLVLQVCAYLSARVLNLHSSKLPGETAEKTLRSKELKLGRSGVGKSVRRNLVIRITTTQSNHQCYQEWPQTNCEPAARKLQEKTTAGQEKWCNSGKWEKTLLED